MWKPCSSEQSGRDEITLHMQHTVLLLQLLVVSRLDPTISGQLKMSQKNTWIYFSSLYFLVIQIFHSSFSRSQHTQGDVDVCLKDSMEFKSYCNFEEKESQDSIFSGKEKHECNALIFTLFTLYCCSLKKIFSNACLTNFAILP